MIADGSYSDLYKKWFGMDVMETKSAKEYRQKHVQENEKDFIKFLFKEAG